MLMTHYAHNREAKRNLMLKSLDCPGRLRNVRKLRENLRTLWAFGTAEKKQTSHSFSINHESSLESKIRVDHHKHTTKCLKLT
jgi:hypothetical protein